MPWLRQHYLGLVEQALSLVDADPGQLLSAPAARGRSGLRQGRDAFDLGGLAAVVASEEQRVALGQVAGLMALLEGHGDVTMDRAGAGRVPVGRAVQPGPARAPPARRRRWPRPSGG